MVLNRSCWVYRGAFILCSPSLLVGCAPALYSNTGFSIRIVGNQAIIQGALRKGDGQRFLNGVSGKEIQSIAINSSGGDVESGIEIGKFVRDKQVPVRVLGVCGSSCANYIAFASPSVTVAHGGMILLHGGISENHDESLKWLKENVPSENFSNAMNYMKRIEEAEESFFASMPFLDPAILSVSREVVNKNHIEAWLPTQSELNCYGYHVQNYSIAAAHTPEFKTSAQLQFPPQIKCKL